MGYIRLVLRCYCWYIGWNGRLYSCYRAAAGEGLDAGGRGAGGGGRGVRVRRGGGVRCGFAVLAKSSAV